MSFELVPIKTDLSVSGFHSVYYFEFDIDFYHPPEKHDFWELVYVDYGRINAIVDGVGCSLTEGQVIFHRPLELHSHIGNGKDAGNVVVISFSCDSPLAYYFDKKIFTLDKKSRKILSLFLAEATNAFGKVCSDYHNTSPLDFTNAPIGSSQLMQGYLVEFLFSIMRNNSSELVSSIEPTQDARQLAENSLTDSIVYYLADHLSETPSLDSLCKHFSVSRTYLCRIFKEATGTSPVNYWISLKIQEAKRLLREGNQNITQISEHLGYSNIHHFTRMFRRFTGMPPSAYKASIKQ